MFRMAMYNSRTRIKNITLLPSTSRNRDDKVTRLKRAEELYRQAKILVEEHGDLQQSGSLILKALAEERKAQNTGLQLVNVIKYRPKTKVDFGFRS